MIYLLRHGEIESDGVRRFIGQTDAPLSRNGVHQARYWQEVLSTIDLEGIYASDLSRCADTARIIAAGRGLAPRFLTELREISLGGMEGLAMDQFRTDFPEMWDQRGKHIDSFTPAGGESFRDLQKRVVPSFEAIYSRHAGHVLVITHAGVIRSILCHVLEIPLAHLFRIGQSYGGMNLLAPYENSFRIVGINLPKLP